MPNAVRYLLLSVLLVIAGSTFAKGTYLTVEQFLHSAFDGSPPALSKLWLDSEQRAAVAAIVDHSVALRVNYWQRDRRSAWVLEEIGKELPITIGVVIEDNALIDVRILAFRESRGSEVRYPFFTRQFIGRSLRGDKPRLEGHIDGISGATMSVDAVTRAATAALFMDSLLNQHSQQVSR